MIAPTFVGGALRCLLCTYMLHILSDIPIFMQKIYKELV